jgi:hypothetical protein
MATLRQAIDACLGVTADSLVFGLMAARPDNHSGAETRHRSHDK